MNALTDGRRPHIRARRLVIVAFSLALSSFALSAAVDEMARAAAPSGAPPPPVTIRAASDAPPDAPPMGQRVFLPIIASEFIGHATSTPTNTHTTSPTKPATTPSTATPTRTATRASTGTPTRTPTRTATATSTATRAPTGSPVRRPTNTRTPTPVDTTPPQTYITDGPNDLSYNCRPKFEFYGDDFGGSGVRMYFCRLHYTGWQVCTSPMEYRLYESGDYEFFVYAEDWAGNKDPTPAFYSWRFLNFGCL